MLPMHTEPFSISHFSYVIIAYHGIHDSSIGLSNSYGMVLAALNLGHTQPDPTPH